MCGSVCIKQSYGKGKRSTDSNTTARTFTKDTPGQTGKNTAALRGVSSITVGEHLGTAGTRDCKSYEHAKRIITLTVSNKK